MDISTPNDPNTNEEIYLASTLGEYAGELPAPITRTEKYLYAIAQNAGGSIIIYAETHTTKEGCIVPVLTDDQIIAAYNGIMAGKVVVIIDDEDTTAMQAFEASSADETMAVRFIFDDKLILNYKEGGEIEATKLNNRQYIHNVSIDTTTAVGIWRYQFQFMNNTATSYAQLAHIGHNLYINHPGVKIPANGVATQNSELYYVTGLVAEQDNMVTVELYKASDGTRTTISSGAIDVTDVVM